MSVLIFKNDKSPLEDLLETNNGDRLKTISVSPTTINELNIHQLK